MTERNAIKTPKVTVVTVTYNLIKNGREQYFRQCLESVRDQFYQNIEHIVIDGASTDGTLDILEKYRAQGWINYYSEPDNGIYDAMNKGIEKSTGKYVVFLNSDDFFHNKLAVSLSVKKLEEDGGDFSCAYTRVIYEEEPVAVIPPRPETFIFDMPACHQSIFVKRSVLIEERGFDSSSYKIYADYDLVVRLLLKGKKISVVKENIVSFRWGASGREVDVSRNELQLLRKRYFKDLVSLLEYPNYYFYGGHTYFEYEVSLSALEKIKKLVDKSLIQKLSELKYIRSEKQKAVFSFGRYYMPYVRRYTSFGRAIFSTSTEVEDIPPFLMKKTYRLFSWEVFAIESEPMKRTYKLFGYPILQRWLCGINGD